ncbi:MAG: hypothetical protein WAP47_08665, partial [Candidatus Rokuibacteriota bacterium]
MYPQPDDDLMHRALTAETELREAEEQLEQAARRIAQLMERDERKTALLLDINARITAILDMERRPACDCVPGNTDDCP